MLKNIKNIVIINHGKVANNSLNELFNCNGYRSISRHMYDHAKNHFNLDEETLIVSITRHPKTYLPSQFFELWTQDNDFFIEKDKRSTTHIKYILTEFHKRLYKYCTKEFNHVWGNATYKNGPWFEWFDWEFNNNLKCNVFDSKFDYHKKYLYHERQKDGKTIKIIIIRYEDFDSWIDIFKNLGLKLSNKELPKKNIGNRKRYGEIYQLFKKQNKYNDEEISLFNNSIIVKHFYQDFK